MAALVAIFADSQDINGEIVNAQNLQGDPEFANVTAQDFSINVSSAAFGSGDEIVQSAGSIVSNELANTDVAFVDTSGVATQANEEQDRPADGEIFSGESDLFTNSRDTFVGETSLVVSPSVGAYEAAYDIESMRISSTITAADLADREGNIQVQTVSATDRTIAIIIARDDTDDSTEGTQEVEFEFTDAARYVDTNGDVSEERTEEVEFDERQNFNNSVRVKVFTPASLPEVLAETVPAVYTNSGERITNTRITRTVTDCPKVDLIGVDYNLNTLICISEQYDRNVKNVPFGLGIGWGQGPPSIRMRGKNVYRVLNNSPSTDYVK